MRLILTIIACLALTACGGSSDGGSSAGPAPLPTVAVALSSSTASATGVEGVTSASINVSATTSRSVASTAYLDAQYDHAVFSHVTITNGASNGKFNLAITTVSDMGGGDHVITLRLCEDSACARVYPGSTASFTYSLNLTLEDWGTFQRNAAHTAFVNLKLDPARFAKIWEWDRPDPADLSPKSINYVSTGGGNIYVSYIKNGGYQNQKAVALALKETDGSVLWRKDMGAEIVFRPTTDTWELNATPNFATAPAFSTNTVFIGMNKEYSAGYFPGGYVALNAQTGTQKYIVQADEAASYPYSQVSKEPSFANGKLYTLTYGISLAPPFPGPNYITAHNISDGQRVWLTQYATYGLRDQVPALASGALYLTGNTANGQRAFYMDSGTGTPLVPFTTSGKFGGPDTPFSVMVGANHNLVYSLGSSTTLGGKLVSENATDQSITWQTTDKYATVPALAKGVVYAGNATTVRLDALNEQTGAVIWSWTPPSTDTGFTRNVAVTANLVFVSTDKAVYAIDLTSHQSVWSYPVPGWLAISASKILYITTGAIASDGKLVAVKLN